MTAEQGTAEDPIRVVLVDDEPMVLAHLRTILGDADDLEIAGTAQDGAEAIELAARLRPDVMLIDLRMPEIDGLTAIQRIAAMPNAPALVALTTFDTDSHVLTALRSGASGFLLKSTPPEDLLNLIRVAADGHTVMSRQATRRVLGAAAGEQRRTQQAKSRLRGLTTRELDLLACLGEGLSNAAIAGRLHLSEATVKSYVSRMLTKLGYSNRTQAGLLAREAGIS
ncbi:response regulator [Actinokineospora enzanensis]|uniref:response regulator n=1 Tax=Actinokineospora enzanensis TaxID=155975 RepID=UPI0004774659|nr:response regulator transcription factor [Actinokineospora enzanensis]